ncbi:MAG: phosphatase PAP2 family protein [Chloroflexi bacterium]|nr:MAG: phosphatase PAP2 family protein [Chloroflexota bacterium]
MWGITQIGNGLTALFLAIIFFLLRFRELAMAIILGMLSLLLVTEVLKSLTERKRPFTHHLEARIVGLKARGLSFPSGHTAQTFFLMSLLVQFFSLSILGSILLYILAALVGLTRMYVGAHYPRDVLAGAILGVVWGILTGMISIGLLPW